MAKYIEVLKTCETRNISCIEAARMLDISERHFRRLRDSYAQDGAEVLVDKRRSQASHRKASEAEVELVLNAYRDHHFGTNMRHFHDILQENCAINGFKRGYTWTKEVLQSHGLTPKAKARGKHRKKREPKAMRGMMLHQDGSMHEWLIGQPPLDLIVTLDDATNEVYSMFFVAQEGSFSTLRGLHETISANGLFSSFYTDRGSHYFNTPVAGGKVDKINVTQVGRALKQLGITHIPSYSPQARGRMERVFGTLQGRLPHDLAKAGLKEVNDANDWLKNTYLKQHNARFARLPTQEQTAFVPFIGNLEEILCLEENRTVKSDNCVAYATKTLQIPADTHRYHYVKTQVIVREYLDKSLALFHGPRLLARYNRFGDRVEPVKEVTQKAA